MPMVAALLPRASFPARPRPLLPSIAYLSGLHVAHLFAPFGPSKPRLHAVPACAAVPFNEFDVKIRSKSYSSKELHSMKSKHSALEMGEEKDELLDYLRSLQHEKVEDAIHSAIHGLLATVSPNMHPSPPHESENMMAGNTWKDDSSEHDNIYLTFQPMIIVHRDFLARLLFWLVGHHIRDLEYRLGLVQLLNISGNEQTISPDGITE